MSDLLQDLEPQALWRHFLALSRIPRASRQEREAAWWVADQGRALGCEVETDPAGNVLLRKPATPGKEGRPGVVLQGHVDMVCEKNEGTSHDFSRDPIDVFREGDVLRARGTTLGADDGVGVAAALAVLSSPEVRHGPLEVLVTVDEETGLTGANALRPGWLRGAYLLNLDSEEEGEVTIGCAGGIDTVATRRVMLRPAPGGRSALRLKVLGLKGGHSGTDIGAGRANALRVLAQALAEVIPAHGALLGTLRGGNKRNAIPREASAVLAVEPGREEALRADAARIGRDVRAALGAFDPNVRIELEPAECEQVLSPEDASALVGLLLAGPHGVEAMSPAIPGLVQTSTNLGLAEIADGQAALTFLTRSALDSSKRALAGRIGAICRLAGFEPRNEGSYPGWNPEPDSGLATLVGRAHEDVLGRPMKLKAVHAGLECGLIGEKYPGMQMVSIGPEIRDAHTPDEHVSIPSVQRFWKHLVAVLDRI